MATIPRAARGRPALRVLQLIDSLTLGGAEACLGTLVPALEEVGVASSVCCLKSIGGNPLEAELRERGIEVHNLESRGLRDLRAFGALRRLLSELDVDLVHAHLTDAGIWGAVACRLQRIPLVATVHAAPGTAGRGLRGRVRERLLRALLARRSCRTLAVSGWLRERIAAAWPEVSDRLEVVHNGVDPAPSGKEYPQPPDPPVTGAGGFRDAAEPSREVVKPSQGALDPFRGALDLPGDAPLVSTVAVLRGGKGLDTLLRAVPRVLAATPEARFALVGDGPLRGELEARADELGVSGACRFTGVRSDLRPLYAATDVFVLPSVDDAMPTVLLEAMAAGVAAVACRSGGVPEIVEDGVTGLLVEPGDAEGLGGAVARLLASPAERQRMGTAAVERQRSLFSATGWARRLRAIYTDCVEGRP